MTDEATEAAHRGPPAIPREPDPRRPLFFVSHANAYAAGPDTAEPDPNSLVSKFFIDLSHNVSQLVYRPPGADPGFLDREMRGGVEWERKILTAVGTCQVFIALVSDPYAQREWCGKEWYAFTRRRTWDRADLIPVENPCLIPVVWAPILDGRRPGIVGTRQFFVPKSPDVGIGPLYLDEGIYGLLRIDLRAYDVAVWRLAQLIQHYVFTYWVEPDIPESIDGLRNVFDEGKNA